MCTNAHLRKKAKQSEGCPVHDHGCRYVFERLVVHKNVDSIPEGASGTGRTTFVNTLCESDVLPHKIIEKPEEAHIEAGIKIKPANVGQWFISYGTSPYPRNIFQSLRRMVSESRSLWLILRDSETTLTTSMRLSPSSNIIPLLKFVQFPGNHDLS